MVTKLRMLFALVLSITLNPSTAQYCIGNRFTQVDYFTNNDIDTLLNVTYGNAPNWQGNNEVLKLDFYLPKTSVDTLAKRPFILIIHGGAFKNGDKADYSEMCNDFAKRGFVTASMNYRLGYGQSDPSGVQKAVYRAQQDARAALRFTIDIADSLRIDTAWIFTGGGSAGSITSILTQYAGEEFWEYSHPGVVSAVGPLDSSGNNLTHTYTVKALYNNSGASISGSLCTCRSDLLPMISFHGEFDNVVPIDTASNGLIGSRVLHGVLNENGVCNDFTVDPTGSHTPYIGPLMVARVSCFFKSLFCNTCADFYSAGYEAPSCW